MADTKEYDTWFKGFETKFPTPEKRYEATRLIAESNGDKLADNTHIGRNILVAHWAEDRERLRRVAHQMYRLTGTVANGADQPVLLFKSGTPRDIAQLNEYGRERYVEFVYGKLASDEVAYGFNRRAPRKPTETNEANQHLPFGISVCLRDMVRVVVDVVGQPEVIPGRELTSVAAYIGQVTLVNNPSVYHRTKQMVWRPMIIGEDYVYPLLAELSEGFPSMPNVEGVKQPQAA